MVAGAHRDDGVAGVAGATREPAKRMGSSDRGGPWCPPSRRPCVDVEWGKMGVAGLHRRLSAQAVESAQAMGAAKGVRSRWIAGGRGVAGSNVPGRHGGDGVARARGVAGVTEALRAARAVGTPAGGVGLRLGAGARPPAARVASQPPAPRIARSVPHAARRPPPPTATRVSVWRPARAEHVPRRPPPVGPTIIVECRVSMVS